MTQFIRILCGAAYNAKLQAHSLRQQHYTTTFSPLPHTVQLCSWGNRYRGSYLQTIKGSEGRLIVANER